MAQCFAVHYPGRVIKLAMTGTGIGPRGLSEEHKKQVIATREGQIAKGGYAFGARVTALLGPRPARNERAGAQRVRGTSARGFMHGVKLGLTEGYSPDKAAGPPSPVLMI